MTSAADRVRIAVAIVLTAAAIALHVLFFTHAGGLWRDEANSATMSEKLSTLRWSDLQFDSFPAAWPLLLRAWTLIAGTSDHAYRLFGLLVGLATIGALWIAARTARVGVPLLSLLLFALNGGSVRTTDSIRGYGAAIVVIVLLLAALHAFIESATMRRRLVVFACAIAAVHLLYQNCALVFALLIAATLAIARERRWRDVIFLLASGATAAATMLIYVPIVRASRAWISILEGNYDLPWFWTNVRSAIDHGGAAAFIAWALATIIAVVIATRTIQRKEALFGLAALVLAPLSYFILLSKISLLTSWWYYVPLLAVCAAVLDAMLPTVARVLSPLIAVLGVAALVSSWSVVTVRQTNVDLLARETARKATARDLIVVSGWPVGVSYRRYHAAAARWETVPPMSSHDWHRWDENLAHAHDPHAMDSLVAAVSATLRNGGRVYVIATGTIPDAPPPPPPPFRGTVRQSASYWRRQLWGALAAEHASVVERFTPDVEVSELEHLTLEIWQVDQRNLRLSRSRATPSTRLSSGASTSRCFKTSCAMPLFASANIDCISSSLNDVPSPVPWISTKRPFSVATMFMSTAAFESSS